MADPRSCAERGARVAGRSPLELSVGEALSVDLASYVRDDDTPDTDLAWSLSGEGVDIVWQEGANASVYLSSPQSVQAVLYLQYEIQKATKL